MSSLDSWRGILMETRKSELKNLMKLLIRLIVE